MAFAFQPGRHYRCRVDRWFPRHDPSPERIGVQRRGTGRRIENLKPAVKLGAIDQYVVDAKEGVKKADIVILATPVDTYQRHLKEWAPV